MPPQRRRRAVASVPVTSQTSTQEEFKNRPTYRWWLSLSLVLSLIGGLLVAINFVRSQDRSSTSDDMSVLDSEVVWGPGDLQQRTLNPSDIDLIPAPHHPLSDQKFQAFKVGITDSRLPANPHPRALHGRLAVSFPHKELPHIDVSLDRSFPDYRDEACQSAPYYDPEVSASLPSASVIIIFADEPFETLARTLHSVLNNSPPHLLEEIILVDDGSTNSYIATSDGLLERYIVHLPKVNLVRTGTRQGIMRARTQGIVQAKSDIFVVLDSHVEAQPGWLEPLVHRVQENPLSFVTPQIDSIEMQKGYKPVKGGIPCHLGIIWRLQDHAFKVMAGISPLDRLTEDVKSPTSSPVMAGGLFAASKEVFFAVGGYDLQMSAWGAENVELGFRLWMCGARIDCMQCSRLGHIFDRGQTYTGGLESRGGQEDYVKNRLRTAGVWMDEFAALSHQQLGRPRWELAGNMDSMFQLRKDLQCQSFKWFLENVWPESVVMDLLKDVPLDGPIRSVRHPTSCLSDHAFQPGGSVERGHNLELFQSQNKSRRGLGCPWFLYFANERIHAIAGGFDDETILHHDPKTDRLYFDWDNDGLRLSARWIVDEIEDRSDDRYYMKVRIKSEGDARCLTLIEGSGSSQQVELHACIEDDDRQQWLWLRSEHVFDKRRPYKEWLEND